MERGEKEGLEGRIFKNSEKYKYVDQTLSYVNMSIFWTTCGM